MNELEKKYREEHFIEEYPKLESSTVALIKDAIESGLKYEIIDENRSFIKIYSDKKCEYIVQATKTSKDSFAFPYIVDDKEFSKRLMRENGLAVPNGILLNKSFSHEIINEKIKTFENKKVVVKPRTTNCGMGITVFEENVKLDQLLNAIMFAFSYDEDVIVEEFAKGKEYRFVVIDGKCISVVHRRSASVVGNGVNTIKELIDEKNKEPWHAIMDSQLVIIDDVVIDFLKLQNLTLDSVPSKNERIFLRKNSNVSTGGESIDMTNIMPDFFKSISEKAANIFDAKICGVDILIDDLKNEDYSIVEINQNPGICINEWPYEGEGEKIGVYILKLLDLI